jgi:hypothetical protein
MGRRLAGTEFAVMEEVMEFCKGEGGWRFFGLGEVVREEEELRGNFTCKKSSNSTKNTSSYHTTAS